MKLVTRVFPSILAIDYQNEQKLKEALHTLEKSGVSFIHIDVMDGKFVENVTFDDKFVAKLKELTNLHLDVHLMVEDPSEQYIEQYIKAGAEIITVHYEAVKDLEKTLRYIKSKNVLAGVAVSPDTPAIMLSTILKTDLVDVVCVMSVQPGAYGQTFIPGSGEKVAEVREMNKNVFIMVDGGVTLKNARMLRKIGANILVSSSTIFNSPDVKRTIRQLKGQDFWAFFDKFRRKKHCF